ncbi:UDP-N-acetylglucosamine 1-carboxyvinyltransferase 2 [Oxobacter pfennigii]|uniref:UDP-N-acetylglucosamine 1-carboxyvinyltransferase n=1 Tax=Oxobacter pfennigii TaxID=36849 RepID=A0A0P8W5F4_9CLOT|nr:UDP-N-acetylglucosamine 1-carboxyvinyltransferase [Oxobacter pfennigii]KPU42852.1 UDP-N-acetylglucosamine 1-carboxyvinyltransferase 2 [Oxobacter pfennigii]
MEKFLIEGGNQLQGRIVIGGAKNAAVALLPAAIMADDSICTIDNLPNINDVKVLAEIIKELGGKVDESDNQTLSIDSKGITTYKAISENVKKMRASYYLLGAMLGKFGHAEVIYPGGCNIGVRPIDQHIKGFQALGAKVKTEHGIIKVYADRLVGTSIYLDVVSVGATINIMLAACRAEGTTEIENAAKEPHIVDVANFLNSMGANIRGAGTDVIKIKGVRELKGCTYSVIPDQIEAGTFMIAAAATGGDVTIENVIPKHLESITAKLMEMGVEVLEDLDNIRVRGVKKSRGINLKTLPYPGFPTDLQQPMTAVLSVAEGRSIVTESIYEARFKHVDELKRMGANIKVEGRAAIIDGIDRLSGASVKASDLRAGAALMIAGLIAEGNTEISDIKHIDRGYEYIEEKLNSLGANIKRIKSEGEED